MTMPEELPSETVQPEKASAQATATTKANASAGGIARNALFGYGATVIGAVTGLVVTPLLLHHLGSAQFGLWMLLLSVVGYLGLLEVGLYMTVAKRVAEYVARDEEKMLQQVLGTALLMYLALGVGALLISGVLAGMVGQLFHLTPETIPTARACLLVLGVNQLAVFLLRLQPAILFGAGRLDVLTAIASLISMLAAVVNVFLALQGYDIVALAGATLVSTIVSGLLIRHKIRQILPQIEIHPRYASRETSAELLKFGSRNATLSVAGTLAFGADMLIIGLLLPVANVAHYALASKLTNLLKELCQKPIDVLLPAYSHAQANRDEARQFQMWSESISLSMAICLPFVVAVWAFGPQIIFAWVGPDHEESATIGAILALMILLQLPGHASFMILTGTERNAFLVRVYVIAAVLNVALSVLLTRQLGPVGPALGSLFTVVVVDLCILPWHVCHEFGFAYRDYVKKSLLPLLPELAAAVLVALSGKYLQVPQSTAVTLLMVGLVALASWSAWGLWGIDAVRRGSYMRTARAAFHRLAPHAS